MDKSQALNILGLTGNPNEGEIKKAYRQKAKDSHPDKHKGDKQAEERFKKISEAYQFITNPQPQAQQRDTSHRNPFGGTGFTEADVFDAYVRSAFNATFGGQQRPSAKPRPGSTPYRLPDVDVGPFNISLRQALFREVITLMVNVQAACTNCFGDANIWKACNKCSSTGVIATQGRTAQGFILSSTRPCSFCNGSGWLRTITCHKCNNKLIYHKNKSINFKLPSSYVTGQKVSIAKQGNESWGMQHGNIYLTPRIKIPDLSSIIDDAERDKLAKLLNIVSKNN